MSIIKSIKQVLGLSGTASENHFWDGSVPNQLSLKRGTPDAPGATVLLVNNGEVDFKPMVGTFLPTIVGSTTPGVGTYTTQFGDYRVVGKVVFFNLAMSWTAHTGTGDMSIAGLPFANYNRAVVVQPYISGISMTAGNIMQLFVNTNNTTIGIRQVAQGLSATNVPMDAAGTLNVSGFYFLP